MKEILIRIFKNAYFTTGVIIFVVMLVLGISLGFAWGETLLSAAILSAVGVGARLVLRKMGKRIKT